MPSWQRHYLVACTFAIGFVLAYLVTDYFRLPRVFYDGVARELALVRRAPPLPMGYYGLWLWGLLAGGVLAGAAALGTRALRRPLEPTTLHLVGGWAMALVAIGLGYFAWHNWPFA